MLDNVKENINQKFKRIEKFILPGIATILFLLFVAFATREGSKREFKDFEITVSSSAGEKFLVKEDIKFLLDNKFKRQNVRNDSFFLAEIEENLNSNPYVKKAQVYSDMQGKIFIEVEQKKPVLRVFPSNGQGFYLDEYGKIMPLSFNYSAKVPVLTGKLEVNKDSLNGQILRDAFELTKKISADNFLNSFISDLHVDEDKNFILTPRFGNQRIILGKIQDADTKLNNLATFYKSVMVNNNWNRYKTINLNFKDQIIAKK